MPLIDVIFLLLTFFIYAMVLVVRAELVPMEMREFASGVAAQPSPAVTISIDSSGELFLDRVVIAMEDVLEEVQQVVAERPETVVYIAADERGDADRLPLFFELYDRLANAGLDIRLVGKPGESAQE